MPPRLPALPRPSRGAPAGRTPGSFHVRSGCPRRAQAGEERPPKPANTDLSDAPEDPDSIRVSGASKVAAVAGKIAHTVRASTQPSLSVVGKPSINQAVKAIAVARK